MRIYISGPITGNAAAEAQFERAAAAIEDSGHTYINPMKLSEVMPGISWSQSMTLDFTMISWADAICFLEGWESSRGSVQERNAAKVYGIPVYDLQTGVLTYEIDAQSV